MGQFKSPETARGSARRRPGSVQSPNTRMNIEKYLVQQIKSEDDELESKAVVIAAATTVTTTTTTTATTTIGANDPANPATGEVSPVGYHPTNNANHASRQKENVPESEADRKTRKRLRTTRKKPVAKTAVANSKSKLGTATEEKVIDTKEKFITDYFHPRRSQRRTKAEVLKSNQLLMEDKILREDETGFEIVKYEDKGRGVVSMLDLKAGDFVLEYAGDLIDLKEARRREEMYAHDTAVGCYMYYFQHENSSYCVDATQESTRLGRLINHSIKGANLRTKSVKIGGRPRLIFLAKRNISSGEELLYDYGDRSKLSLQSHPWLKN